MAQSLLLSKHKALSSNPSTTKWGGRVGKKGERRRKRSSEHGQSLSLHVWVPLSPNQQSTIQQTQKTSPERPDLLLISSHGTLAFTTCQGQVCSSNWPTGQLFFLFVFQYWGIKLSFLSQELSHMIHKPSPFCFSYFSDSVLYFCSGWPQTSNLLLTSPEQLRLQACTTTQLVFEM
jgi:hypothetical protein